MYNDIMVIDGYNEIPYFLPLYKAIDECAEVNACQRCYARRGRKASCSCVEGFEPTARTGQVGCFTRGKKKL